MRDNSLMKRINIHVFSVTVRSLAARKNEDERAYAGLYLERHSIKRI